MSTVFSSVLNFSILGLLCRLHRLNIQAVLQADVEKSGIRFPCAEKHLERSGMKLYVAPSVASISNKEIRKAVECALSKAKGTLSSLEMDQLLKKHSMWDNMKWNNVGDCDVESDANDDSDDQDDDQVEDAESVVKEEVVSTVIQEVCDDDLVEVEKDLQSISKEGIAELKISEKLGKFKKSLTPIKLNSAMPCYAFTSSYRNAEEVGKKQFLPYVEVSLNDRSFSIRNTTAIWLLQESERVSSDRLFRVREKQPFSSTLQSLMQVSCANPVMLATLTLGDLCLFKLTIDNWKLGRILQFAKYNTDIKKYSKPYKEQNAKASTKNVGVLCTWYEHVKYSMFQLTKNREMEYKPLESYICTLPEDCIIISGTGEDNSVSDLPPAKQPSLTAKNFSIKEQCMESLLEMVENYKVNKELKSDQKSREKSETSATNTLTGASPIFIPDDSDLPTIKDH